MIALTWVHIVSLAAGSSVLAALLTQLLNIIQEKGRRGRTAGFLAIRLATLLEEFSEACMSVIGDFDTFKQSSGGAGKRTTSLPKLASFPDDAEGWRALPQGLAGRALTFPNHVRAGQEKISFTWSVADEHAAWDDCREECARLGLAAWEIARRLREAFNFPKFEPRYDIEAALQRELAHWIEQK